MKYKNQKKKNGFLFILQLLHIYFKYTSLKRNTYFRKSTSNILEFPHKYINLENLLQVYFRVSK